MKQDLEIPLTIETLKALYKRAYNDGRQAKNVCGGLSQLDTISDETIAITICLAVIDDKRLKE